MARSPTRNRQLKARLAEERPPLGTRLRKTALIAAPVILTVGAVAWLVHVGWIDRQARHIANATLSLTRQAHFAVRDVTVQGRVYTDRDKLMAALNVSEGDAIFGFDPDAAQKRVAALPWVSQVAIERRLPDAIIVHLQERVPMARWQHDGHVNVIDSDGHVLPDAQPESFASLPLVVGTDAPVETKRLLDLLDAVPVVRQNMKAAVRAGERRWDLHLSPDVTVKLPENTEKTALERLSRLITEQKILEHDIVAIDLRYADHMVFERGTVPPSRQAGGTHP